MCSPRSTDLLVRVLLAQVNIEFRLWVWVVEFGPEVDNDSVQEEVVELDRRSEHTLSIEVL